MKIISFIKKPPAIFSFLSFLLALLVWFGFSPKSFIAVFTYIFLQSPNWIFRILIVISLFWAIYITIWTKKRLSKDKIEDSKKEIISPKKKYEKLKQLIQNKFNRKKEKIDSELDKNIGNIMEKFAHKGTLTSDMFAKEAIYLHSDRIFKLLLARASINREVLLENKPIESDKEIELAMQDLEEIAEAEKSVIFRCENILNRMNEKDYFVRRMSENRTTILSDIERYLINEKDENLLLKKRGR